MRKSRVRRRRALQSALALLQQRVPPSQELPRLPIRTSKAWTWTTWSSATSGLFARAVAVAFAHVRPGEPTLRVFNPMVESRLASPPRWCRSSTPTCLSRRLGGWNSPHGLTLHFIATVVPCAARQAAAELSAARRRRRRANH